MELDFSCGHVGSITVKTGMESRGQKKKPQDNYSPSDFGNIKVTKLTKILFVFQIE